VVLLKCVVDENVGKEAGFPALGDTWPDKTTPHGRLNTHSAAWPSFQEAN
jgi:hypothetical protein